MSHNIIECNILYYFSVDPSTVKMCIIILFYLSKSIYSGEFNFTRLLEVQTPVLNNEGCKRAFADNHTVIDDRVLCLNTRQDNCQVILWY